MKENLQRYPPHEALSPSGVTLGHQVRGEAIRRGGQWEADADRYAALAVRWYGRRPCKGEDLHTVFDEVFRTDLSGGRMARSNLLHQMLIANGLLSSGGTILTSS